MRASSARTGLVGSTTVVAGDAGIRVRRPTPGGSDLRPSTASRARVEPRSGEELQVRRTAQRILAAHLCLPPRISGSALRHRPPPRRALWPRISLDLTGAALVDFNFEGVSVVRASFNKATFHGGTSFMWATFKGHASFGAATFRDVAGFDKATFRDVAEFVGATFRSDAEFVGANFRTAPRSARRPSRATPGSTGRKCCTLTIRTSTSIGRGQMGTPSAPIRLTPPAARWSTQNRRRSPEPAVPPPDPTDR
jgi:hypothetical protein